MKEIKLMYSIANITIKVITPFKCSRIVNIMMNGQCKLLRFYVFKVNVAPKLYVYTPQP